MPDLRPLLSPKSLAIVGAASDESIRGRLTKQLIGHGFDGPIYPVTRSQSEILGHKAYRSVADLPEPVDLAVVLDAALHLVAYDLRRRGRLVRDFAPVPKVNSSTGRAACWLRSAAPR